MEDKEQWKLVFAVNGGRFELSNVDPSTTLLEFLRTQTPYKGTKLGCGEGGCGACVVLLSKYDPVLEQVEEFTVSSCLTLICSLNGCSITTTEGLGNSKSGFHPIHQRFAGFHASQCGYCTPGMCMSFFSALLNSEKSQRPDPPPGFSKLTVAEAEKAIASNLCRCTGYRPIADACKSFASDVDLEDLGLNCFWKNGESKDVSKLPFYDQKSEISTFPEFLKEEMKPKTLLDSEECSWYNPVSIEELQSLLESKLTENGARVKLVVGNTGTGYYKELEHFNTYISLKHIPDLSMIRRDSSGIEIGATVTISKAIQALREDGEGGFHSTIFFKKIADHMDKVATVFIRNTASLGGNLVMAQRNHFPSDIATILLATDSLVDIQKGCRRQKLTLEEFLEMPPCDSETILLSVTIPSWEPVENSSSETKTQLLFETYRAAPRPLGNALPYLNAAFLAQISSCISSDGVVLESVQLSFGAYGTKHAIRVRKVEEFLAGKFLNVGLLFEAIKLLREIVVPDKGISHPPYRSSLVASFLFDFLHPLVEARTGIFSDGLNGYINGFPVKASRPVNEFDQFDQTKRLGILSPAKQLVKVNREFHPVGEPIKKTGAEIQASGEAVYVDDIPSPKDCLHGAFIYSTKPLAHVKGIKFKSTVLPRGVLGVISVKDIPAGGKNIGITSSLGYEPLFADGLTEFAGQALALVVADTQKHADMAAANAVVDYDTEGLEAPILTVEDAVEKSSFFTIPPFAKPKQVGDFAKEMAEAEHKILSEEVNLESQYYFYMETQTTFAMPDEDNCMVVYSSSQCSEDTQMVIASCLGMPEHNVRVITRRVGGGFGGKAYRAMPVATACAVAAHKLNRPVRIYLNRRTDMIMTGGRHPMKINYSAGFKSNGKITALRVDILINAGISEDFSPIMPHTIERALKKYDWGALSLDVKVCKTNHTSKSAMRAPGDVQGSYIAEAVIEHVASYLSMEVDSVRNINLHSFESLKLYYEKGAGESLEYTLPSIFDKVAVSSSFQQRIAEIRHFNSCNKWRKRGISRVPAVYEVAVRTTAGRVSILNDGSIVVEVGGIEIGQGLWTKVKQMVAFGLSPLLCSGREGFLEKIRVVQADSLSLVQGGLTAGSTTSESSCAAVRECCDMLVERLTPVKERLRKQMDTVSWDVLILQAHLQYVNLSASTFYVPDFTSNQYLNYGAAVSEVEIDLLTGATTILQTDIIYDCGQSLNPAVDLGQIEGAFVQGIGFFMLEENLTNSDGLVVSEGTWTYKIPTIDTIPKRLNVEILNSEHHEKRVLSSKASGEPPLLLAVSVHCAIRAAIIEARKQLLSWKGSDGSCSSFQLKVPATMPVIKELCGLDNVESYLQSLLSHQ
ncbi:indole-3-acetaldehyde oxidase-like isoform X1 [Macadamia integrifolia]|uniref:indole-3-acetaldehyde oxidase-like isoform X1 n=1 Tax=Macadamia integrifolia TaxID=60698 RepID=UPI001C4E673F|nr:indole-3-acetaldehyde oxidase-like isoform X1 [Macadamia integrifolia]XP_042511890.1 indole-3-acetaldehyde oxidase-like isoform X1 [Macadamia integrifolia]